MTAVASAVDSMAGSGVVDADPGDTSGHVRDQASGSSGSAV
jgi:hypothetical protein